jgi:hypothetical protein
MFFRTGLECQLQDRTLREGTLWTIFFITFGNGSGIFRTPVIFTRSCNRILPRTTQLEESVLGQFFRSGFFLALAVMITCGVLLDCFSEGYYFLEGIFVHR